jgi:hypothetical protein
LDSSAHYKPAATTIPNIISILKDSGAAFTPGSLAYTLSGTVPATLKHTLLQKWNGTFYLTLWMDQIIIIRSRRAR